MAYGICNICGREVPWSARRGSSIKDVRCPDCGGTICGMTAGNKGPNTGRRMEVCTVCGKRAYIFLHPKEDYKVEWPGRGETSEEREKIYPAGSPCCSTHNPLPLDYNRSYQDLEFRSPEWCAAHNRVELFRKEAGCKHARTMEPPAPGDPDYKENGTAAKVGETS